MSMQAGTYRAKVTGASLEALGDANYPVLKVEFSPYTFLNGSVFVEGTYKSVDKIYFLSADLAVKGKFAGQSKIEILRNELKDTYGYTDGLTQEALNKLSGLDLEIVVELNKNGYPQVKWVNKPGGKRKASKALPPDILAKLNAAFMGQPATAPSTNPGDFFAGLKAGG